MYTRVHSFVFYVCLCAFVCICVCLGVFSSSEQSSGNVWVTHEEMENLASSTKAVSTIWVLPFPSPPTKHSHTHTVPTVTHICPLPEDPLNTHYITRIFVLMLGM